MLRQLRKSGVRIEVPDQDTVLLRNVPLRERDCFNKQRTNMLCRKAGAGDGYLVFVDEDLSYRGPDTELHKAFTAGPTQNGWRALMLGSPVQPGAGTAVEDGLAALGFEGRPQLRATSGAGAAPAGAPEGQGALEAFGLDLSERIAADEDVEPTVGRVPQIEAVVSCLLRWGQARLPLVVGPSGTGKSNLLFAVARLLRRARPDVRVVRVDLASLFAGSLFEAEREKLLSALFREARERPDTVLAFEHAECVARETPHGLHLLAGALDGQTRIAGVLLPQHVHRFRAAPLARRIQWVPLREPSPRETAAILERLRPRLAAHHRVELGPSALRLCLKKALSLDGHLPAKAIVLVDEAASNAALLGTKDVGPDDVSAAFRRCGGSAEGEKCQK